MKNCLQNVLVFLGFCLIGTACTPEKKPIDYGADNCVFCNMTIVDQKFGSEIVTDKSKVYKFDAVECMINFLKEGKVDTANVAMKLVNAFDDPGKLHDAEKCHYLRSEDMPSPMGMHLNPFTKQSKAQEKQKENSGIIYDWETLYEAFDDFSASKNGMN